jgi:hypothetical protein
MESNRQRTASFGYPRTTPEFGDDFGSIDDADYWVRDDRMSRGLLHSLSL